MRTRKLDISLLAEVAAAFSSRSRPGGEIRAEQVRLGRDSSHETGQLAREGGRARGRVIPPRGKGAINCYFPRRI